MDPYTGSVTKGTKDSLTKDPVNYVATQEVAQVTKGGSGGSAKVKVKRWELQMKSADMLQSFSYVCRMFHFGSNHLFQHVFDEHKPNTSETDVCLKHNVANFKTNVETNDETTDSECEFKLCCIWNCRQWQWLHVLLWCCRVLSRRSWHIWTHRVERPLREDRFRSIWSEIQVWLDVCGPCFRMLRGFPQVEDLTQDDVDDSDVMGDRSQAGEVSEVGPGTPDGPEGSDLECSVPELGDRRLRMEHECRGHWPYDRGCDDCVQ